jgi:hypothetical protein
MVRRRGGQAATIMLTAPVVLLVLLVISPSPARAQWVKYPSAGVPRTATGAPNLGAPAPKTADGKPDLSGIWITEDNRPCPAEGCADMKVGQQFVDIGWGLKGGLPYQPWAAALSRQRTAELRLNDPNSQCLPTGIVRMHTTPLFRKVVQTPGLLIILNERQVWYRQIFTDGRPLPADPQPTWNGYSVGRWDGDTLVVQSNGFRDGIWLDSNGSPMTEAAKITERFRRPDYGTLDITITVDDPKAYTAPWTTTVRHLVALDTDLIDYVCQENEKDVPHLIGK